RAGDDGRPGQRPGADGIGPSAARGAGAAARGAAQRHLPGVLRRADARGGGPAAGRPTGHGQDAHPPGHEPPARPAAGTRRGVEVMKPNPIDPAEWAALYAAGALPPAEAAALEARLAAGDDDCAAELRRLDPVLAALFG